MQTATMTYHPDLTTHPGPITRGVLVLEMGGQRLESKPIGPRRAEAAIAAMKQAFGNVIIEGETPFIM